MRLPACVSIVCLLASALVLADENNGRPNENAAATNSANVQATPAPQPNECRDECSQATPAPKPTEGGKASKDHNRDDDDGVEDDDNDDEDESSSKKKGHSPEHSSGTLTDNEEPSPTESGNHHKHHSKGHHKHSKTSSSHATNHEDASGSEEEEVFKTHRDVSTVKSYDRLEDLFNAGVHYSASMQVTVTGLVMASLAAGYWY
ncbi:hypothetical protein H4R35_005854 [Dimargaris xerosporica]|nr:hypothetical protein H4R35_005854 [Dimargaris xerosporica]